MEIIIAKRGTETRVAAPFTPSGRTAIEEEAKRLGPEAEATARRALVRHAGMRLTRASAEVATVAAVLAAGPEEDRELAERLCKLGAAVVDVAEELDPAPSPGDVS